MKEKSPEELAIYQKRYRELKKNHEEKLAKQKELQDLMIERDRIDKKLMRAEIKVRGLRKHIQRLDLRIRSLKEN